MAIGAYEVGVVSVGAISVGVESFGVGPTGGTPSRGGGGAASSVGAGMLVLHSQGSNQHEIVPSGSRAVAVVVVGGDVPSMGVAGSVAAGAGQGTKPSITLPLTGSTTVVGMGLHSGVGVGDGTAVIMGVGVGGGHGRRPTIVLPEEGSMTVVETGGQSACRFSSGLESVSDVRMRNVERV